MLIMASLSHSLIVEYLGCFQVIVTKIAAMDISLTMFCHFSEDTVTYQPQKNHCP